MAPLRIEIIYLSHLEDLAVLEASPRFVRKVIKVPAVKDKLDVNISLDRDAGLDNEDTSDLHAYIRDRIATESHPLALPPWETVVDNGLRVKAVKGSRYVVASVIPVHMNGNIMASIYVIAEKAANIMLEDAQAY
jgi:choline dehydrogenase-like flavoprotein